LTIYRKQGGGPPFSGKIFYIFSEAHRGVSGDVYGGVYKRGYGGGSPVGYKPPPPPVNIVSIKLSYLYGIWGHRFSIGSLKTH